ncbi:MAG: HmuY family protein [Nitrospinaceae bacterium]
MNLCVTLLLIGIFWLPAKLVQMEKFFNSPSVNLPKQGKTAKSPSQPAPPSRNPNLMETRYVAINASSEKEWTYFDFSRGAVVRIFDPSSVEWDLAFRRSKVISNGGATNKFGNAGLIDLGVTEFDSVAEVPNEDYVQDVTTRTETENTVLLKWYKYNYLTHKLSAKKNVYALRTADNKFAKVQFLNFYCDNKETGCIRMRYIYQNNGTTSFLKNQEGFSSPAVASNPPSRSME